MDNLKKFKHPLMDNNITIEDRLAAANFIKNNKIFTQSKKVIEFERKWSRWLGVKHSVFVNSGSSANFLTLTALKILYGEGGEVIVPPLTWSSDIVSVINNNFKPVFVDINLKNLSMNTDQIIKVLSN